MAGEYRNHCLYHGDPALRGPLFGVAAASVHGREISCGTEFHRGLMPNSGARGLPHSYSPAEIDSHHVFEVPVTLSSFRVPAHGDGLQWSAVTANFVKPNCDDTICLPYLCGRNGAFFRPEIAIWSRRDSNRFVSSLNDQGRPSGPDRASRA